VRRHGVGDHARLDGIPRLSEAFQVVAAQQVCVTSDDVAVRPFQDVVPTCMYSAVPTVNGEQFVVDDSAVHLVPVWKMIPQAKADDAKLGHETAPSTPEEVRARIVAEQKQYSAAVKIAKLKSE